MTLDVALSYAQSGWAVFPIIARGKRPACPNGFEDATTDSALIRAMWNGNASLNVGVATGARSGIFVVDIDGDEGRRSLEALPALPQTLTCVTASGAHLYFIMPNLDLRCSQSKVGRKIDIRANGGYVVAPTSVHPDGHIYRWVDASVPVAVAPQWLIDRIMAERPRPEASTQRYEATAGEGWTIEEVRRMLACIPPDIDYDSWVKVGMALHNGKFGLGLWDEWSRGGEKYETGCTLTRWSRFRDTGGVTMGTLVHLAQQWGWKPLPRPIEEHDDDPDVQQIRKNWAARKKASRPAEAAAGLVETPPATPAEPLPPVSLLSFDPTDLPGLIGDTVRWIVSSAVKPQPELALLNTIAALGAVFGRRYKSPLSTCTNVYMVGIAATVSGKDHSRKQIKQLLVLAGLEQYMGSDGVRSGVGVIKSLLTKPSQVMHLDEFGMLLQAVADIKGAHYMRAFGKNLLELYSSAGSSIDIGAVADVKAQDIIIHQPSLCIYGTTTLETYVPALNRASISSGTLNRFVVLPSAAERPIRRRFIENPDPPPALVEAWRALATKIPLWSGAIRADQQTVDWAGCEDRIFDLGLFEDEQFDRSPHGTGALWGRYRENVIKIAMISALSRGSVIQHYDLDLAESIVRPSVRYMQTLAVEHMSDSQHENDCLEVLRHVKSRGGEIAYTDLYRLMRRLSTKQLSEVTSTLMDQGLIETVSIPNEGRGRPGRLIRLAA